MKILIIDTESRYDDDPEITIKEPSTPQEKANAIANLLDSETIETMEELLKLPSFIEKLVQHGFQDAEAVRKANENAEYTDKYYLYGGSYNVQPFNFALTS